MLKVAVLDDYQRIALQFADWDRLRPSCEITVVARDKGFEDYGKMGALDLILQQDAEQLPLVQRGLKAGATQKVLLAKYQEVRIRHYHQTIDDYINR